MHKGEVAEKSKNFGAAIKRLFKELRGAKVFAIIAILCAAAGSVLTIIAPDKLADLTDEITKGLRPGLDINFDIVWVCSQNSCETPDKSWSDLKSLFPGQYLPPMRPRP